MIRKITVTLHSACILVLFHGFTIIENVTRISVPPLRVKLINLVPCQGSNVHGTVLFKENLDRSTNIAITIKNTVSDTVYLSQINNGSSESPGSLALAFPAMKGSALFASQIIFSVRTLTDSADKLLTVTYDDLIKFPGYISVHTAATPMHKLIATGNINQNIPLTPAGSKTFQ